MRAAKLRMINVSRYPVYEMRQLHRTTYCMRTARYISSYMAHAIVKFGLPKYLDDHAFSFDKAKKYYAESGDPILVYVELLSTITMLCAVAKNTNCSFSEENIISGALHLVNDTKNISTLFRQDLAAMGINSVLAPKAFSPFEKLGVLLHADPSMADLNANWVAKYKEEDAIAHYDWSYHSDAQTANNS
jgi:hypothetical protein